MSEGRPVWLIDTASEDIYDALYTKSLIIIIYRTVSYNMF